MLDMVETHIHGVGEDVINIKMACTLHFGWSISIK